LKSFQEFSPTLGILRVFAAWKPKELRKASCFSEFEQALSNIAAPNSETKPICNISLCSREADWEVELFGKPEYYCERHRPSVPETLMTKLKHSQSV